MPADSQTSLDLLTHSVGSDDDRATLSEEELQAEQDVQFEAATAATLGPTTDAKARGLFAREQRLLDQMTELAESARGLPDARIRKLVEWIRTNICPQLGKPGTKWNDTRCIIFTEYDDTKRYVQQQLPQTPNSGEGHRRNDGPF